MAHNTSRTGFSEPKDGSTTMQAGKSRLSLTAIGVFVMLLGSAQAATSIDITIVDVTECAGFAGYDYYHTFEIHGELTGDASAGLAGFSLDLRATLGGVPYELTEAVVQPPSDNSMDWFALSPGVTNVAGYGGTLIAGKLVQIGGAQDTTGRSGQTSPVPVALNVAVGAPQVLARVTVELTQAPATGETYDFIVENFRGNVINPSQTGPIYAVTAMEPPSAATTASWTCVGACCQDETCVDNVSEGDCPFNAGYVCDVNAIYVLGTSGAGSCGNRVADEDCGANCNSTCIAGCHLGDADGNRVVTASDRGQISANIGQTDPELVCLFDLDGNGVINAADRGQVSAEICNCTPLKNYQNGSGLNEAGTGPDPRFPQPQEFRGLGTTCAEVSCD